MPEHTPGYVAALAAAEHTAVVQPSRQNGEPVPAICFVDTETTGLDPRKHHAWEIAVIRRDPDGDQNEYLWQVNVDLQNADPDALRINRYHERYTLPKGVAAAAVCPDGNHPTFHLELPEFLFDLQNELRDAVLIGSNPAFDDTFLKKLMHDNGRRVGWHYRTVDIATLAAGYRLGQAASGAYGGDFLFTGDYPALPYKSYDLSQAVGVDPPSPDVAHTALGDARWARDVYDAVTKGAVA